MNLRKIGLFLAITTFFVFNAQAQDKKADKEKHQEAAKLNNKAAKLWDKGERVEAEKLFYQAHELYYVINGLRSLANLKMNEGDVRGANKCFDQVIKKLESYNGEVMVYSPTMTAWSSDYKYTGTKDIILSVYIDKAAANYLKGDIDMALKSYRTYFDLGGDKGNLPYATQAAFYGEDKQALLGFMKDLETASSKERKHLDFCYAFLDILDKKYPAAIEKLLKIEDDGAGFAYSKMFARHSLAFAYALNKEPEKSETEIKQVLKNIIIGKNFPFLSYFRGLNELTKGNNDEAIRYFTEEIKPNKGIYSRNALAMFKHYAGRAEAYMAKKDFVKARQDFESALLYKSDYDAALIGIAKLEGKVIQERKTDKEPPVITLTEPSATRGLKVSSAGFDVTFRGIAKDPSGLKSVNINGTDIYAQENGSFWGNITLKEGMNNVVIKATDIAGNVGQLEVKIEKVAPEKKEEIIPVVAKEAKNYALIIASQNYDDASIPSLENPITDAVKLKFTLKNNYSFSEDNIFTLFNPGVNDFKKKFTDLMEAVQPEDNLIIFYAGHGIWVDKEKKGYWLLADAKRNDVNTWLSNKLVLDYISKIQSRHTLLITDACFSGSVFKTRSIGADASPAVREMSEKISRVAITSGNDTEVPDESVFMKYLVKALSENKDKYLTAQKMFITQIIEAVMAESKTEPRYGTLELAGHVGGDYIFIKK